MKDKEKKASERENQDRLIEKRKTERGRKQQSKTKGFSERDKSSIKAKCKQNGKQRWAKKSIENNEGITFVK